MDIYKEMYYMLFNKLSDVIEEIKKVQAEAEEAFMSCSDKLEENGEYIEVIKKISHIVLNKRERDTR